MESFLVEAWSELLPIEMHAIDLRSDFFLLGGQSIKAIRLINHIREKQGIDLKLKEVFLHSELKAMAKLLESKSTKKISSIQRLPESDTYELSPAQKRLWVMNGMDEAEQAYTIPLSIWIKGRVNRDAMKGAFRLMMQRHEALRMVFVPDSEGLPVVRILDIGHVSLEMQVQNVSDWESPETKQSVASFLNATFNLEQGPLCRMLLLWNESCSQLHLVQHHIISDGWSLSIFYEEFMQAYHALNENQSPQFADIPVMAAYLCLISLIFVLINLTVDLLYFAVDPRLRAGLGKHSGGH
jgi:aryl carrier-like protein